MIVTTILMLIFVATAPAFAQTPAPLMLIQEKRWDDFAKELEKSTKHLEQSMKERALRIQEEAMRKHGDLLGDLALQLPVPTVPPVPPADTRGRIREKMKPRDPRRRVPEGWVESTEPFSRTFKVTKGAALMLTNIGGNIQVSPGGNDQIEVQAIKHAWGPNAEQAKQRLGDFTIEVFATGNRVELRVEQAQAGRKDGRGVDIEFDVKVPADASVELRTVSGDIRVTNVRGEVRAQGVSGNLALEGTTRLAAAKTVSGDITLTKAGADAQLSLSTVSGNLLVQTLTTRALDLNTISGDIRIDGWSGERAAIRTLSGDLNLQTSLTKGGRYDLESHSGNIQLAMPEQPGFDLDASTFSGRIRIDFPIKSEGPIRDSDRGPRSVRGTYGDASSSLRLQTFSGDLTVTRR